MPPTLTLTAGMQEQWWGGRLTNAVLTTRLRLLQKASHCKTKLFLYSRTVPATYHITLK